MVKPFLLKALSAFGVLVFAVGTAVVPFYLTVLVMFTHNGMYANIALPVLLISAALWVWAGFRYVIRPGRPRYWWRALAAVIIFVGVVFGHQWMLGLPGRIGELRFQSALRPGMTIAQATDLASSVGGDPSNGAPNTMTIRFVDNTTFCFSGGNEYTIQFDDHQLLKSWKSKPWTNFCRW